MNGVEHRDTTYGAHLQQHVDDTLEFQKHRFSFKCEVELNESNYNDNSVNNNINNGDIHNSNSNNKATMTKTWLQTLKITCKGKPIFALSVAIYSVNSEGVGLEEERAAQLAMMYYIIRCIYSIMFYCYWFRDPRSQGILENYCY